MTQIFADRLAFRKLDLVEERGARWKPCTNQYKQPTLITSSADNIASSSGRRLNSSLSMDSSIDIAVAPHETQHRQDNTERALCRVLDEAAQALRGLNDHLPPRPAKPDCVLAVAAPSVLRPIGCKKVPIQAYRCFEYKFRLTIIG